MRATFQFTLATLAAAIFCHGTVTGSAASFTTNSFSDAFVTTGPSGNLSGDNFGGAGALSVAAPGLANGEFQSVLQFDTSAAVSSFNTQFGAHQWTIQSVTLQLTATPNNNPGTFNTTAAGLFNVSLMLNNSWTEGTGTPASPTTTGITFNALQSTFINNSVDQSLGTGLSFNGATSGAASYSLTLSPTLLSDIGSGGDIDLRLFADDSVVSMLVNSRSGGSGTSHPEIIINAIPEPGTIALGALGLATILGCRLVRRRVP